VSQGIPRSPAPPWQGSLDPRELAHLASLALRARTIVEGAFSGSHRNLHPGTSVEFTEHREYAPGDDIRRIDWKAVGRTDRYYVKRFEDETEMHAYLVLDASASMAYQRRALRKFDYATALAGAIAYLLAQQGDAAGLLLFDEASRKVLPPSTRPGQIHEVFRRLEEAQPAGRTDAARALGYLGELVDKRSLIIVMSDLLDCEPDGPTDEARGPLMERLRQLRAWGHDLTLFHLLDPDEVTLPFDDLVHFEGMEPGDTRTLLAQAPDLAAAFTLESAAFRQRWRNACLKAGIEYRFAATDASPAAILRAFLVDRQKNTRA